MPDRHKSRFSEEKELPVYMISHAYMREAKDVPTVSVSDVFLAASQFQKNSNTSTHNHTSTIFSFSRATMKIIRTASLFVLLATSASAFSTQSNVAGRKPTFLSSSVADLVGVGKNTPSVADDQKTLRVLALHGKEESGTTFRSTMNNWRDDILIDHDVHMVIDTLDAPFSEGKGKAWWTTPQGVRSYEADTYEGFEESKQIVLDAINGAEEPYDLVVGHSQGAMLAASLLAKDDIPKHPNVGYVLNGLAWPKPFKEDLENMEFKNEKPSLLLVNGMRDKVNPPEQAEEIKEKLKKAGAKVRSVKHPKGHAVPISKDETVKVILNWIVEEAN